MQLPWRTRNHQLFKQVGKTAGFQLCCSVCYSLGYELYRHQISTSSFFFLGTFTAIILDSFIYYVCTMPITTSCCVVVFMHFYNVSVRKNHLASQTAFGCLPTNLILQNLENSPSIQVSGSPGMHYKSTLSHSLSCPALPMFLDRSFPSLFKDRNGVWRAPNAPFWGWWGEMGGNIKKEAAFTSQHFSSIL